MYPGGQTRQNCSSKHLEHGADEELDGRSTGRYTRVSAIPRPRERIYENLRGRGKLPIRIFDRGYQSSRGRSIVPWSRLYRLSTDVRMSHKDIRITVIKDIF